MPGSDEERGDPALRSSQQYSARLLIGTGSYHHRLVMFTSLQGLGSHDYLQAGGNSQSFAELFFR